MSWGLNYRLAEGRDGEWLLNLTLDIGAGALAPGWTLHLDLPRAVAGGEGTHLQQQTGSHLILAPEDTEQRTLQLSLLADSLQRLSDLPAAPYLAWKDSVEELEVLGDNLLDFLGAETSAATVSAPGEARVRHTLLPAPRQFTEREGELPLQLPLSIQDAPPAFNLARGYLEREGILTDAGGATRRHRRHEAFINPCRSQCRLKIGDVRLDGLLPDIRHRSGTHRPIPGARPRGNSRFGVSVCFCKAAAITAVAKARQHNAARFGAMGWHLV